MKKPIKYFVRESALLNSLIREYAAKGEKPPKIIIEELTKGWGQGYAIIPPKHPYYGIVPDVDVHGGVTFSEYAKDIDWPEISAEDKTGYVIGFDTLHAWDTPEQWPKENVEAEAKRLAEQLESMWKSHRIKNACLHWAAKLLSFLQKTLTRCVSVIFRWKR